MRDSAGISPDFAGLAPQCLEPSSALRWVPSLTTGKAASLRSEASTVEAYLEELPPERRDALAAVRRLILEHLPEGNDERIQPGMIGYSVPLARYSVTDNKLPLAFAALASRKRDLAVYLNGVCRPRPQA